MQVFGQDLLLAKQVSLHFVTVMIHFTLCFCVALVEPQVLSLYRQMQQNLPRVLSIYDLHLPLDNARAAVRSVTSKTIMENMGVRGWYVEGGGGYVWRHCATQNHFVL